MAGASVHNSADCALTCLFAPAMNLASRLVFQLDAEGMCRDMGIVLLA